MVAGPPVRLKYYGMFYISKPTYVRIQAVVLVLSVLLLVASLLWRPTGTLANNLLFGNLPWVVLLILVLEIAEAAIMLQKFAAAETRQRAKPF